jgi:hypothetical protein
MVGETVYLQKYVGRFLLKIDSFNVSADGKSAFFGKKALDSGMYALGFEQKLFCNFFISNATGRRIAKAVSGNDAGFVYQVAQPTRNTTLKQPDFLPFRFNCSISSC